MNGSRIIEVESLTKDFFSPLSLHQLLTLDFGFSDRKPTRALEDISFWLKRGEILGVLGPNGSGKTTLLKIISTLILPDKGRVLVNGYQVGRDDDKIKALISLASSQERSLYWRLTGRQNLEFFAAMYGLDKKESRIRIENLFSIFNVDYQNKRFDSYSTGMKQKFVLIRALFNNPELLLFDEPTKSLDYDTASRFRGFIKDDLVKKQGRTVIFTTHHMEEALDFGDRFMVLHKGKLLAFGSLEELRRTVDSPAASLGEIFLKLTRGNQIC